MSEPALRPASSGTVRSFDGTVLAWQVFGEGPLVVVANGIGVAWGGMAPQIRHLVGRGHRVLTWDYRGLFGSAHTGDGGLAVPAHARDALQLLDTLGEGSVPWVGWSMGVNVAFEAAWQAPDRVRAIFGIGGVPWSPFRAFAGPGLHRLLRAGSSALVPASPLASPLLRRVVPTETFFELSKRVRYIRDTTDREAFQAMAADVASHDHRRYLRTLAALGRHDLRAELGRIHTPATLLAGGRDLLIRPSVVRAVAEALPAGEAIVVPSTSHFLHLEDAPAVHEHLDRFLSRHPPS